MYKSISSAALFATLIFPSRTTLKLKYRDVHIESIPYTIRGTNPAITSKIISFAEILFKQDSFI